ncbi:hypothetical protein LY39_01680 [Roseinatronobacter bogoriensis subsp. barguzinensis]|nr:hypothetical protein [Rhodobaca bogoriensis DSM 18756]TDW38657.1 hypothetical protein LY39_01680 [Rhodobaca barguzinensis]TDY69304.1 hypothetical protein EV660_104187 [Rhodobaca bogoriensis DSM 18756]
MRDFAVIRLCGIEAEGRRDSKGRPHGTAIWLPQAQISDLSRIWPV